MRDDRFMLAEIYASLDARQVVYRMAKMVDAGVPAVPSGTPVETPEVEDLESTDTAVSPPWMTILHNCDCHTFDQVVKQLMKAIACSEERGWELAWQVHNTGKAVVKVGSETECVRVGNVLASIGLVVTVTQS